MKKLIKIIRKNKKLGFYQLKVSAKNLMAEVIKSMPGSRVNEVVVCRATFHSDDHSAGNKRTNKLVGNTDPQVNLNVNNLFSGKLTEQGFGSLPLQLGVSLLCSTFRSNNLLM